MIIFASGHDDILAKVAWKCSTAFHTIVLDRMPVASMLRDFLLFYLYSLFWFSAIKVLADCWTPSSPLRIVPFYCFIWDPSLIMRIRRVKSWKSRLSTSWAFLILAGKSFVTGSKRVVNWLQKDYSSSPPWGHDIDYTIIYSHVWYNCCACRYRG